MSIETLRRVNRLGKRRRYRDEHSHRDSDAWTADRFERLFNPVMSIQSGGLFRSAFDEIRWFSHLIRSEARTPLPAQIERLRSGECRSSSQCLRLAVDHSQDRVMRFD